jgi:hypothetical protein
LASGTSGPFSGESLPYTGGIGSLGGGAASIGGLEAANELSFIGRRIASSPSVANAMKLAVIGADEKKLMGLFPSLTLVRIGMGQAAGAGLRQMFTQPSDPEQPLQGTPY